MSTAETIQTPESRPKAPIEIDRLMSKLLVTEGADAERKLSSFWVLLVLATIIATAGIIADSTATVIGAMIVAPLMIPILGTALSVVLADRRLIVRNLLMIVAGMACVIGIAYLIGMTTHAHLVAETNSQIAGRVSPRLIDLVGALATGVVGAFAMVRTDVSDTLPGVAIAISLVPPLAVVGLTLESGAPAQAMGALLLFGTNVAAIIATGTIIFLAYGVRSAAIRNRVKIGRLTSGSLVAVIAAVVIIAIPLGIGSAMVVQQEVVISKATPAARAWAEAQGWQMSNIELRDNVLRIIAVGPPPTIQEVGLRQRLDDAGLKDVDAKVTLILGGSKDLPGQPR
ncbi:MAG: TIGR00341 family protein [Propionibacteriaceae bacterium]